MNINLLTENIYEILIRVELVVLGNFRVNKEINEICIHETLWQDRLTYRGLPNFIFNDGRNIECIAEVNDLTINTFTFWRSIYGCMIKSYRDAKCIIMMNKLDKNGTHIINVFLAENIVLYDLTLVRSIINDANFAAYDFSMKLLLDNNKYEFIWCDEHGRYDKILSEREVVFIMALCIFDYKTINPYLNITDDNYYQSYYEHLSDFRSGMWWVINHVIELNKLWV